MLLPEEMYSIFCRSLLARSIGTASHGFMFEKEPISEFLDNAGASIYHRRIAKKDREVC